MKAIIDRFEGKHAVLLFGGEELLVNMPIELLPKGVREGDILHVNIEIDQNATIAQREKIEGLLFKLKNKNL